MASIPNSIDDSAFKQALNKFRSKLTTEQAQDFQLTTIDDLKSAISNLQKQQMLERRMRNMKRLENFLLRMEQFEQIVNVYLNASMFVGFVWTAISYSTAFDAVLGMYETIGLNLPQLEQYQTLFQANPHMRTILHLIYADILRFHKKALKFFRHPVWRRLFQAQWNSSKVKFTRITESFQSHKTLLESQASLIEFAEYRKFISDEQDKYRQYKGDEDRRKRIAVRDWLNTVNPGDDQEKYAQERSKYPETGRWILRDKLVSVWCNSSITPTPLLWLTGIPGAGKTILASVVIEELQKCHSGGIVFFYCKHDDQGRNSFLSIARGLLSQLMKHNKELLPHLYECAAESATGSFTSTSSAQELLSLGFRSLPSIYIILDGIDECPSDESRHIISWFKKEVESINNDSGDARCLFISQDDQICRQLLKDTPTLRVSKDKNIDDIRVYCNSLSQSWVNLFNISENRRKDVVGSVVNNAAGMFLFARLVIYNLCNQVSRADFNRETSSGMLPKGLDEAYDRIISRILTGNDAQARYARKLLGWVVCTKRPLKWHEIQGAVSIDIDTRTIDFEDRRLSLDPKQLCGSLVEIRAGGTIELVHTTAKLYLLNKRLVVESDEAYNLFQLCLVYLNHPSVHNTLTNDDLRKLVLAGHYAFFDYAVIHWISHLEDCLTHIQNYSSNSFQILGHELDDFLSKHGIEENQYSVSNRTKVMLRPFQNMAFYNRLLRAFEYWKSETTLSSHQKRGSPVLDLNFVIQTIRAEIEALTVEQHSLQSFYGERLFKCSRLYCKFFADGFTDLGQRDQHCQQHERSFLCELPGCPASQLGFASKSDLDSHNANSHQALSRSAEFPVYQYPASIDVEHACKSGNLAEVMRWAEQFGPVELNNSIWETEKGGGLAVQNAVSNGQFAVVKFLLDKSLEPGKHILTVIQRAYLEKKYSFLQSILQISHVKPYISAKDEKNISLWVRTLFRRHDDIVARGLMKYFRLHGMALQPKWMSWAAYSGCLVSLEYMLDALGDPGLVEKHEVMSSAAAYGRRDICKLLIDKGFWDSRASSTKGPLGAASSNGHEDIIDIILQECPATEDNQRWFRISLLYHAARHGNADSVKRLLEDQELQLNLWDRNCCTPLDHASMKGFLNVVSVLVDSGRDIGLNNGLGRDLDGGVTFGTPLGLATFFGHVAIVRLLLRCEHIDIDAKISCRIDRRSRALTPLQLAKEKSYHEIADAIEEFQAKRKGVAVEEYKAVANNNTAKEHADSQASLSIDHIPDLDSSFANTPETIPQHQDGNLLSSQPMPLLEGSEDSVSEDTDVDIQVP